ncbi:MAG: glutathione transport system substrate-binding protein [Microbacteriaceae bacterium]|jgi:peptide/nickel transport system substrate-binding protein|nr:glutathione transport system substrate-binding protein [Microbacteriaceae bacterium]MDQ1553166.1 glutathione transport system substrate-binding protein [Microbacteriaceae bacterium]
MLMVFLSSVRQNARNRPAVSSSCTGGKLKITRRRARHAIAAIAIAGTAALALAACTTSGTTTPSAGTGGTVSVAVVNDFTSFNSSTPQGNLDTNGQVGYLDGSYGTGFQYIDSDFKIVHDTKFGTFEKTSDSPQTVKYTLNKGLKWSDGQPITADDMVLAWAIGSGYYDSATFDPTSGDVTKGTQYFQIAASTAGLDATSFPKVSSDNLSITLTYSTPYVDWELVNPIAQPAHIVAEKAGLKSAADLTKLLKGLPKGDPSNPAAPDPTLDKAAKFVNTGYDVTAFPTDKTLTVSSGPFVVSSWTPGQSLTMTRNKYYAGGLVPKIDSIVFRFIGDASAQVTALQNGEVDVINPQASADTLTALKQAGAKVLTGDQVSYDHLDLNFGSPVFKDKTIREAFLKTIPRQQILDSIVTPVNPKAKVLDSQIFLPANPPYDATVKMNGSSAYDKVDIEGAKALLKGATPTIRILYNTANPNRVDEFQAIQASAAKAGFKIVDAGSPQWSSLLPGGDYDASLFGWISPGAGTSALPQLFSSQGGGNYNKYTGANKDALATQTTLDPKKLITLEQAIDKQTFTDAYGLPLFQLPGVFGTSTRVNGIKYMGNQTGPFWNFWEWSVKKSS